MASLSASEIRSYASKAGFSGADLDIAVAVALAESGGVTTAHNPDASTKDNSYGLWQINMYSDLGPSRRKQFKLANNEQLFDPTVNAHVAHEIFKQQGWDDGWTTYGTKKYEDILKVVKSGKDIEGAVGPDGKPTSESIEERGDSGLGGISKAINAFGETVFKGATNFAGVGIAVGLLIVGVVFLIMSSNTAKKAVNVAANVVPGGTVVKGAIKKAVK
jgi:hypothetical protein